MASTELTPLTILKTINCADVRNYFLKSCYNNKRRLRKLAVKSYLVNPQTNTIKLTAGSNCVLQYNTISYIYVRPKADDSHLSLLHGTKQK